MLNKEIKKRQEKIIKMVDELVKKRKNKNDTSLK